MLWQGRYIADTAEIPMQCPGRSQQLQMPVLRNLLRTEPSLEPVPETQAALSLDAKYPHRSKQSREATAELYGKVTLKS